MAKTPKRPDPKVSATTSDWRNKLPDGSKSVQSVWVWRGFFFMSLIALGLGISFTSQHLRFYSLAWYVIAAGWFATSMWLWRKHVRDDNEAWEQMQKSGAKASRTKATNTKSSVTKSSVTKSRGRTR